MSQLKAIATAAVDALTTGGAEGISISDAFDVDEKLAIRLTIWREIRSRELPFKLHNVEGAGHTMDKLGAKSRRQLPLPWSDKPRHRIEKPLGWYWRSSVSLGG